MGGGGAKTGGGAVCEVLPLEKGGGKSVSCAEGGGSALKVLGKFLCGSLKC